MAIGTAGEGAGLCVAVRDDGGGIQPGRADGNGLANMRRRAQRLGAALDVASSSAGTTITVVLPEQSR